MAITQLDKTTALIVIDLQYGIVALPPQHTVPGVIEQTNQLIDAFHQHLLPVVLVNVVGGAPGRTDQRLGAHSVTENWSILIDELHKQDEDIRVTKRTWGAFMHTDLHQQLQQRGVTQVVVVGIATSIGVESTARQAFELGYHVTVCTDAITDLNPDNHRHAVAAIFPRLAETGPTQDVLKLLSAR